MDLVVVVFIQSMVVGADTEQEQQVGEQQDGVCISVPLTVQR